MMKKIFASNDPTKYAFVDDDVAEIIKDMKLKFYIMSKGYFYSTTEIKLQGMAKKKHLLLHRFVYIIKTKTEPTSEVDHIDRDKSNNQFKNLRLASRREQNQHRAKQNNNTSGLIGVSHKHQVGKSYKNGYRDYWYSSITRPDGHREVKYFPYTPEGKIEAGKWRDSKVRDYFGEFAGQLNFPSPSDKDN